MSFWANKLAGGQGNPARSVAPSPAAPASWWNTSQPSPPVPEQVRPTSDESISAALGGMVPASTKARSARLTDACPDCGSGNYMTAQGSSSRLRCYDCGYPLVQSGSGNTVPSTPGQRIEAAKQLSSVSQNRYRGEVFAHL